MNDVIHIAKASLRAHEGLRHHPYLCTAGKQTIAYGRNLDDRGITTDEAEYLLDNDVAECLKDCATFGYWNDLTDRRQAALIDMRFCLGPGGYRTFKKMHAALYARNHEEAAAQIEDSLFAQQTGRRADDLALMMREG
jgi:lysozyme